MDGRMDGRTARQGNIDTYYISIHTYILNGRLVAMGSLRTSAALHRSAPIYYAERFARYYLPIIAILGPVSAPFLLNITFLILQSLQHYSQLIRNTRLPSQTCIQYPSTIKIDRNSPFLPFWGQFQLHFRWMTLFQYSNRFNSTRNRFRTLDCPVKPASNILLRPKLTEIAHFCHFGISFSQFQLHFR